MVQTLRDKILAGELSPGQRLVEAQLAQWLGVSRTPLRYALSVLSSEGLLDRSGGRGYVVRRFSVRDVLNGIDVRGVLDPAFDQLLAKHQVKFSEAYGVDFAALAGMPAVTIKPTTEYDSRQHTLSGPLLTNVLEHVGAPSAGSTQIVMHAVDGYAVATTLDKVRAYTFIVATHMDGKPLPLGGVGPLWATYDADNIPELSSKPLKDRFELSPWGLYHLQVTEA
ncbi:GntR family transcriptional regulator [Paraburkholderia dipogonis]|uniref:GntR family transcriptional regulator n=1 Tax=Paraburkholderia dipogonis TaxID=1211383 RepID=UPI0038B889C3